MRRRRKRKKEKEKREEYLKQFFVFLAKSFVFLPRKKEHIKEIKGTPSFHRDAHGGMQWTFHCSF